MADTALLHPSTAPHAGDAPRAQLPDHAAYLSRILSAKVYALATRTPLTEMAQLSQQLGVNVQLKREDQQPIFSFKIRGAANKLHKVHRDIKGVIAASAGNHAQGVAMAARHYGVPATLVMPRTTPSIKVQAVQALGATILLHGDCYDDAQAHAQMLAEKEGLFWLHPFDDADVIAGQGTIAMELVEQLPHAPDAVFVPVGGGGLIAGMALYLKSVWPQTRVIGVEPKGAESLHTALKTGARTPLQTVDTFADGVAVKQVGKENFRIAQCYVDEVVLVDRDAICAAAKHIFEATRSVVEPSGALALAGLIAYAKSHAGEGGAPSAHSKAPAAQPEMVAICSGANVNFSRVGEMVELAELGDGHEMLLAVRIDEKPGSFLRLCEHIGAHPITEFNYRYGDRAHAHVLIGVRMPNRMQGAALLEILRKNYTLVENLTHDALTQYHLRHMVGGRAGFGDKEALYEIAFPERAGALLDFLTQLGEGQSISLFHYRNHGASLGQALVGFAPGDAAQIHTALTQTGYGFRAITHPLCREFL